MFPITQHCPGTSSGGLSVLKSFVVQISYLDICGKCENIFDQIAHREREARFIVWKGSRLAVGGYYGKKGIYGNEETALIETATHPLSFAKPNTLSPENQTLLAHCHNAINHRAISRLTPTQPKNRGYITHINRPQVKFWTDRRQHQTRILNAANPAPQTAKKKKIAIVKRCRGIGGVCHSVEGLHQRHNRWNAETPQLHKLWLMMRHIC